ncbi:MAG: LacI family DNA-binding transcriptional regulator [Candidatus Promineifilaceae bacterium]|nr:LacI family DNA-binding transcriptional regulator [Candidatus Promineifilaceae bacterium]
MTKNKPTIADIAAQADVSISTVSRVLNNTAPVADSTREAVLTAMRTLDYRPNIFARGLASGQSMTVGVLTQHIHSPLYASLIRGILEEMDLSPYTPLFVDGYWEPEREERLVETLLRRRVDGLIVLGGKMPTEKLQEIATQVPLIIFGHQVPGLENQCLQLDNFDGAYRATEHLISLGHRRIAHVTGNLTHADAVERREGYLQALRDNRIEPLSDLIAEGEFTEQSGVLAIEMLLSRGRTFSAVFAANDESAYGVRLACYRRGIRVPQDMSLVGFDDIRPSAYTTPPLTTVHQPTREIGSAAARAMLKLMNGEAYKLPHIAAELVIRESTARNIK